MFFEILILKRVQGLPFLPVNVLEPVNSGHGRVPLAGCEEERSSPQSTCGAFCAAIYITWRSWWRCGFVHQRASHSYVNLLYWRCGHRELSLIQFSSLSRAVKLINLISQEIYLFNCSLPESIWAAHKAI